MSSTVEKSLDPVQYEIFRHRLFNILEEGRIAMKMVSGSPAVVEGGETMCSFYTSDGTPIITAAGILLHCTGARDFVLKAIEWYEDDPGIYDGDQLFFNDPYIGGQHLPDMIIIKPIFYRGERVAWVGSFMHTPETGGMEPAGQPANSTEIFQEGIRILGLKVIEGGKFRKDVFNSIVQQVRDPHLVGLDTKAKIAANNVCAQNYLRLIEKYGLDFVKVACQNIISDSEAMARARLRSLPDGTWRSRLYADCTGQRERPFKVVCTATKTGDEVTFDFTGSSPQNEGSLNNTLAASWGYLFSVLASQLFWNVPWNGGMVAPVRLIAPEGTVVNCRFPAACSNSVLVTGKLVQATACECIAKMLFAGGIYEDVNAGWSGTTALPYYGGRNQYGAPTAGVILDSFMAGTGAATNRDGVDTGGQMTNPTSNVSDVEVVEMNTPIMYLERRNTPDSGGFGQYVGGMGPEMVYMVHGTKEFRLGLVGGGKKTLGGIGIFGGYPPCVQEARFAKNAHVDQWIAKGTVPRTFDDVGKLGGEVIDPPQTYPSIVLNEHDLLGYRLSPGAGYGDPLDRDPEAVSTDVKRHALSPDTASKMYGVVLDPQSLEVDHSRTGGLRREMRDERLRTARMVSQSDDSRGLREAAAGGKVLLRMHEHLEIVQCQDGRKVIRCLRCGHVFCDADQNYKQHALLRERDLSDVRLRRPASGEPLFVVHQEFICPGCATLLEVDQWCPELDAEQPIVWDISVKV